jgi:succinate dehydrogenase / fumarate reductase membrane anchor subunit
MSYLQMKSPLAKVKNLGSAHSGTGHWWHQRLTSAIMLPLTVWLLYFIHAISGSEMSAALSLAQKPYNIVPMTLLLVTTFYHASLGMRVVIEDYIGNLYIRYVLIVAIQIFSLVTVLSAIFALISLMIL